MYPVINNILFVLYYLSIWKKNLKKYLIIDNDILVKFNIF